MKKAKKISYYFVSVLGLTYLALIFFPHFLFGNTLEYKNFKVHYHSEETDAQRLISILETSLSLLEKSEVYNPEFEQEVFLCSSFGEFTLFAPLSRKAFAVNYPFAKHIFLSTSDIDNDRIRRNGDTNNARTLSGVIAHETVHSLLEDKLGMIKYKLLPSWKNEGYSDYIAKESSYDEQLGRDQICENKNVDSASFKYFTYRIYVQFLLEEKCTLDVFLTHDFNLDNIAIKAKKKYCTTPEGGL